MNYIYPEAAEELKLLGYKLKSLERMRVRIAEIESAKYSISGSTTSASPLPGGGSRHEDKIGTLIVNCEAACAEYAELYRSCIPALSALDALSADERAVLELCFVHRTYGWDTRAAIMLHLSVQRVYQIKSKALRRYGEIRGYKE